MRDVALWVDGAVATCRETTRRGACSVREPETLRDADGEVRLAGIATYCATVHTFVELANYHGVFLPGFRKVEGDDMVARPARLTHIDHIEGNVGGRDEPLGDFYRDVMGFQLFKLFDDKDISRPKKVAGKIRHFPSAQPFHSRGTAGGTRRSLSDYRPRRERTASETWCPQRYRPRALNR